VLPLRLAARMNTGTLFQEPPRITYFVQFFSVHALPSRGAPD
jgi:hypothetical protein